MRSKREFARVLAAVLAAACGERQPSARPAPAAALTVDIAVDAGVADARPESEADVAPDAEAPIDPLRDVFMLQAREGPFQHFDFVPQDWPRVPPKALPEGITFIGAVVGKNVERASGSAPSEEALARALLERERTRSEREPTRHELVWVKGGRVFAGGTGDLRRALAPIDTPEKAKVLLEYGHGRSLEWYSVPGKACIGCAGRFVRKSADGAFEIVGTETLLRRGACPQSNRDPYRALVLYRIDERGMVTRRGETPGPWPPPPPVQPQPCVGRDTEGSGRICAYRRSPGSYLSQLAYDEAISIGSFRRLCRELDAAHAPRSLALRARRAAADEARHAKRVGALAKELGGAPRRVPRRADPVRPARAWILENAVEGCVRETYSAVVTAYQAKHAPHAGARRVFARIARDETEHARLAWDIHDWALSGPADGPVRTELTSAIGAAFDALERGLERRSESDRVDGWEPPREVASRILRGLRARLAA